MGEEDEEYWATFFRSGTMSVSQPLEGFKPSPRPLRKFPTDDSGLAL